MRYGIMVAAAVLIAGCSTVKPEQSEQTAFKRENCIETRCVVTYHQAAPYWTEQHQRFCPQSQFMEAWGTEPEGTWCCTYENGQYSKSGLARPFMKSLPAGLMNAELAALLYTSFTLGSGFEPLSMTPGPVVGIEGRQYESFQLAARVDSPTITAYRNRVSGRIELVRLTDGKEIDWLAQSYNLRFHARLNRMIPRKIDIFDIRDGIPSKKLLIEFDYIDIQ